jgi:hypothetical protein
MTRDEILNMKAGRETDVMVAEKVMGLRLELHLGKPATRTVKDKYDKIRIIPNYSTDISAAWEVVDFMETRCFSISITFVNPDRKSGTTREFSLLTKYQCSISNGETVFAKQAPLAICRAALLAVTDASEKAMK